MSRKNAWMGTLLSLVLTGCACSDGPDLLADANNLNNTNEIAQADAMMPTRIRVFSAFAIVKPLPGNQVRGKVTFTKVSEGVQVVADFDGLTPGSHGFHVHEHGTCEGKEASEAGAHFNPTNEPHGAPNSTSRHVGDLGNLVADENGHAHYERIDKTIALDGKNSIVGRSLIVHLDADDYKTQPAGASGSKIACGIIEADLSK